MELNTSKWNNGVHGGPSASGPAVCSPRWTPTLSSASLTGQAVVGGTHRMGTTDTSEYRQSRQYLSVREGEVFTSKPR